MSFHATDFLQPEVTRLTQDAPDKLSFVTGTRGDTSSIVLKLRNIKRKARVTVSIDPARESGGGPPRFRQPVVSAGTVVDLSLRDLVKGQTRAALPEDIYTDTITLRRVITTGADDVKFGFVDTRDVQGDYYFVRVRLANDAIAWSSPIWVGGMPPR